MTAASPQTDFERQRLLRFGAMLHVATPRTWVFKALVALNVLVYGVMVVAGVHPMEPTVDALRAWGANFGPDTLGGEWWRMLTATFIHVGALHVAMNMYVLWVAGDLVERLLGNAGFAVMYLLSGLGGSVASLLTHPLVTSAGASGAVFGVFGALMGFVVLRRDTIPATALRGLLRSGVFFVGLNVAFGLAVPGIDMAAHLGGLLVGALCGLAMSHALTPAGLASRGRRNVVVLVVGAALIAGATLALPRDVAVFHETYEDVVAQASRLERRYDAAARRAASGQLDDRGLAAVIDGDILPAWRKLRSQMAELDASGETAEARDRVAQFLRLRDDAWTEGAEALRRGDQKRWNRSVELHDAAGASLHATAKE